VFQGGFAVPGLVDAHAHLALNSPAPPTAPEEAIVRASARAQLESGVLLIREPGSSTRGARNLSPRDELPRVQTAGRFLAGPGRYFPGLAREVEPAALPAAVTEEVTWSGHWAKVIGDFFDAEGMITPVFPTEVLVEAAAAAHAAGGRITMHAMTPAAVEQAISAGFDAIEHGSDLTADLIEAMAERDMTWVPTLLIAEPIRQTLRQDPTPDATRILRGLGEQPGMVRRAAASGVRLLAGTDAGMVPHGVVADEIRLLAAAGLAPFDALAAGSWEARTYLGLPSIEVGAPADLVIYPDDPSEDLSVLDHPSLIMIDGMIVFGA
jgi:imidazolonepropionase-like amidohydrolase